MRLTIIIAQVANKEGIFLAHNLNVEGKDGTNIQPFTYKHMGSFAYIGNNHACADIESFKVGGLTAWYLYRGAYFSKQVSWKNRYGLASDWIRTSLFGRDTSRF